MNCFIFINGIVWVNIRRSWGDGELWASCVVSVLRAWRSMGVLWGVECIWSRCAPFVEWEWLSCSVLCDKSLHLFSKFTVFNIKFVKSFSNLIPKLSISYLCVFNNLASYELVYLYKYHNDCAKSLNINYVISILNIFHVKYGHIL